MRLIIAGSRHLFPTANYIGETLRLLQLRPSIIVTGGAKGVDSAAANYAATSNIKLTVYAADWNTYGKSAGPIRNRQMADNADALLLIWDGQSRGSHHIRIVAAERGLQLYEVVISCST